jgi:hypothetical protein
VNPLKNNLLCPLTKKQYHSFLKALLPIPKRKIPAPRRRNTTGQGRGQPKSRVRTPANRSIDSMINKAPAIMKSHFDTVNMISPPISKFVIHVVIG